MQDALKIIASRRQQTMSKLNNFFIIQNRFISFKIFTMKVERLT